MNSLKSQLELFEQERQLDVLANSQREVQSLVNDMFKAKLEYEQADKKFKDLKQKVLELMEKSGVDKLQGEKCNITLKDKTSNSLPKEVPLKLEVFSFIKNNYGEDVLNSLLTINANSFNSLVTKEIENKKIQGEHDFKFPHVKTFEYKSIGIRKKAGV